MRLIYLLIASHMIGDYVLQIDYIAKTKGKNWWHLFSHCITYTLPFALLVGIDWRIGWLLASHFVIDALKARWNKINYAQDQLAHILAFVVYFIK